MAMYAVTTPTASPPRWRGRCPTGSGGYYGQNGINTWIPPFFGAKPWDDPAIYLKMSPISTVNKAKTPTFVYVGERDIECPPAQSIEFYTGMKEAGAPVSLVIYPGEALATACANWPTPPMSAGGRWRCSISIWVEWGEAGMTRPITTVSVIPRAAISQLPTLAWRLAGGFSICQHARMVTFGKLHLEGHPFRVFIGGARHDVFSVWTRQT